MNPQQQAVLIGDAFNHCMANYLDMKDIYNMSLTCSSLYKKFDRNYMIQHIKRKLEYKLKRIFKELESG